MCAHPGDGSGGDMCAHPGDGSGGDMRAPAGTVLGVTCLMQHGIIYKVKM